MGMVKDKFAPDEIWIEETPARGNVVGAMLCQAKGALLVNFEGFVVNMIYPNTIKMVVAGHGLASKIAVREVCKHKVSFEGNVVMDSLDDAWDAIALAVYAFMPKVSKSGPEPPRRFRNDAETQTTQAQV
jgi:Holliday junction resolvasome RuvABC endonuclease subunit